MSPDWTEMRHLSGGSFLEDAGDPERNWLDRYIPPDDQPQVTVAIHEAMGAKRVFDIEHRVRMVDGTIGWTSSRAVPLYGETGEVKGWFGAASNITPLRESQNWLAAQKEAFQAAVSGASLEASLAILVRAATGQMGGGTRCAFYLADDSGAELHHVAGMPEAYSRCVDGFKIGPDSLACGLAVYTGKPVITVDVTEDPVWKQWLWLSQDFKFRGCWSFPIETSGGRVVGTFAMYHEEPRTAEARDLQFAAEMTGAAAIIISRHQETEERARLTRELLQAQERHDREEVRR
jgi:hypothetical protein